MSRRTWAIAVAIVLLALAGPLLRSADAGESRPSRDDIFQEIGATCGGPDVVKECRPAAFAEKFATRLADRMDRNALARRWLAELAQGDAVAAYGLAWLRSKDALPQLRRRLLTDKFFYGWETSTPDPPDAVYADDQYPHHQAFIVAIETITGEPLGRAVQLSAAERARLRREAAGCRDWRVARWLLYKLEGTALPDTAANRRHRLRCDGPGFPGDPGFRSP